MYALDRDYWKSRPTDRRWQRVVDESAAVFGGVRVVPYPYHRGLLCVKLWPHSNTGVGAIVLADFWGARRIILAGYDGKLGPEGEKHHHPDHPGIGNCGSIRSWPKQFRDLAAYLGRRREVLNASRRTVYTMFPRIELEEALCLSAIDTAA